MLFREVNLLIDLVIGQPLNDKRSYTQDVEALWESMEVAHEYTRDSLRASHNHQKRVYDRQVVGMELLVGTAVWLQDPAKKKGLSPKLTLRWQGPYCVTEKLGDVLYHIQMDRNGKNRVVHFNRLKKCFGKETPGWVSKLLPTQTVIVQEKEIGSCSCIVGYGHQHFGPGHARKE